MSRAQCVLRMSGGNARWAFTVRHRDNLVQILLNPLSNAINFTPIAGRVALGASVDEASGRVEISVSDAGCGIPADEMDAISSRSSEKSICVIRRSPNECAPV
jgi:signal transduction histidine kinase